MDNRITSTSAKKQQREALEKALKEEKSQGAALRRLKQLDKQYEFFNLSPFQLAIISEQNAYFGCVQHVYTKKQQKKVKQLDLIKKAENGEDVELLTRESFSVVYSFGDNEERTIKTFGSKEKAKEEQKKLPLQNTSIVTKETPISTAFTPKEMLGRLHKLESEFFSTFENAENVTVAMLKRAIGMEITDKDKEISKDDSHKQPVKKAS